MNILSTLIIHSIMTYNMPTLPYANDALEPVISQETIDYHYGKHLQTYINNLNALVPGTNDEGKSLEEIVATTNDTPIFNNAGQVLNHTLYFLQFTPAPQSKEPTGKLSEDICKNFGCFELELSKISDINEFFGGDDVDFFVLFGFFGALAPKISGLTARCFPTERSEGGRE